MNLVIDDAEEVFEFNKKPGKEVKPSRELGECSSAPVFEVLLLL